MNSSGPTDYWRQQDGNLMSKSHTKVSADPQTTTQYGEGSTYYGGTHGSNPQLKRSYTASDQPTSPFKKRHFSQQITPPPTSSADHTDDDDEDEEGDSLNANLSNNAADKTGGSKRDDSRRRAAHTAAEQKRRNAIRRGYDALQSLVPNSHLLDPISSQKVSKAAILKRSTDYLVQLNNEKQLLSKQLEAKKKETFCLRAVQKTYEDILEMNMNSSRHATATIDDEHKFQVFQSIADTIFLGFDQAMQSGQVSNFSQFTSTMIRWVEDSCRPSIINEIICQVIDKCKS